MSDLSAGAPSWPSKTQATASVVMSPGEEMLLKTVYLYHNFLVRAGLQPKVTSREITSDSKKKNKKKS